jgi:hypothetical protein
MSDDELKLCDCAECGRELVGLSMLPWYSTLTHAERSNYPPLVGGHVKGRPYCAWCLSVPARRPPGGRAGRCDPSPWTENAVRHLEGD